MRWSLFVLGFLTTAPAWGNVSDKAANPSLARREDRRPKVSVASCERYGLKLNERGTACIRRSFLEWCENVDLSDEASLTISQVMNSLDVRDCAEVPAIIRETGRLNLNTRGLKITDLRPLTSLPELRELYLVNNAVHDLEPLRYLPKLHKLSLRGNIVSDVRPLAALSNLEVLDISDNDLNSYRELARLRHLRKIRADFLDKALAPRLDVQFFIVPKKPRQQKPSFDY